MMMTKLVHVFSVMFRRQQNQTLSSSRPQFGRNVQETPLFGKTVSNKTPQKGKTQLFCYRW